MQLDTSVERAELAQAQAQLGLARTNAERADELVRRGAGTQRALDEARATLRTTEASVQLAQARIEKMTVTAPFDGVAGLRRVSVGAFVQAAAEVVNLEQIDPLKVDFDAVRQPPNEGDLMDLLFRLVPDAVLRQRVLVDNPASLFGF